jgi:hypothetical protein
METRQRRSFTDDYKRQAVDLVASSGRSVGSVAKVERSPRANLDLSQGAALAVILSRKTV